MDKGFIRATVLLTKYKGGRQYSEVVWSYSCLVLRALVREGKLFESLRLSQLLHDYLDSLKETEVKS